ncbi:MAG: hypothetical protein QXS66_04260 [Thermoproteota archaeon]
MKPVGRLKHLPRVLRSKSALFRLVEKRIGEGEPTSLGPKV